MTRQTPTELHDHNGSHLDALPREPDEHIPDDGFTDRLMAALPPPRRAPRWRWLILTAFGLAGAVVGLVGLLGLHGSPAGIRLSDLAWQAMTWSPPMLPMGLPVIPLVLAGGLLAGALIQAQASAERGG